MGFPRNRSWADRLDHWWDYLRSGYWAVPTVIVAGAVLLSLLTLHIDQVYPAGLTELGWVWSGSPEGGRGLLSTLAGSTITVAGVLFSIMVVVLSQMSSQFGPRILRGFASDSSNQMVLGTFIGTYLYALLVLRTVRSDPGGFTPHLSITVALLAGLVSMAFLIYFVHHMVVSIQAPVLVGRLAGELRSGIQAFRDEQEEWLEECWSAPEGKPFVLRCDQAGYLQTLDYDRLLSQARRKNLKVQLLVETGEFLYANQEMALVWPESDPPEDMTDCFLQGAQPTPNQDLEFLISQIVQVAVRSMSPGINDPFTASICLRWLGDLFQELCCCPQPGIVRQDEDGQSRLCRKNRRTRLDFVLPPLRQLDFHIAREPMARQTFEELVERLSGCFEGEERQLLVRFLS